MARQYRKFDQEFRDGAVRLVLETGKPIAQVARELGINEGTLGNWCARERRSREGGNPALSESRARGAGAAADRRTSSCGCSVMSSSARWPSGSTRRWAGSGGAVHRRPEGRAPDPARHRVPGAGGQPGVVLQVARRGRLAGGGLAGSSWSSEIRRLFAAHRGRYGSPRITADLRDAGLAGQQEHRREDHARAGPGGPPHGAGARTRLGRGEAGGGPRT